MDYGKMLDVVERIWNEAENAREGKPEKISKFVRMMEIAHNQSMRLHEKLGYYC